MPASQPHARAHLKAACAPGCSLTRDRWSGLVWLAGWLAPCTQINIIRDPRYGRNSELPSEDPTLSGHYASEMVQGMQEGEDQKYMKVHASLKHYTAYSVVRRNAYLLRDLIPKTII